MCIFLQKVSGKMLVNWRICVVSDCTLEHSERIWTHRGVCMTYLVENGDIWISSSPIGHYVEVYNCVTLAWCRSRNSSEASIGRRKLNFGALDIWVIFLFKFWICCREKFLPVILYMAKIQWFFIGGQNVPLKRCCIFKDELYRKFI